eukprot:gene20815-22858_t
MSKRRQWDNLYAKLSKKKKGKDTEKKEDFITVQRLSAQVEGKAQKDSRIGPGPWCLCMAKSALSKISKKFVEAGIEKIGHRSSRNKDSGITGTTSLIDVSIIRPPRTKNGKIPSSSIITRILPAASEVVPKSVPISEMIKLGRLVSPKREHDMVTMALETFDAENGCWADPIEVKIQLDKNKFSSGGIRDAYRCAGKSGLYGSLVLKRYRPQRLFYGKLADEHVTIEIFIPGMFRKYVNNTGDIVTNDGSEAALKAETFAHYTYFASKKHLMVLDLQGCDFSLCDPEIASTELYDADQQINFCAGNLTIQAIRNFLSQHVCNEYCRMLKLVITS